MSWYSVFSRFYDQSLERLYAPHRREALAGLALPPGARALDVACGTGQSFPWLAPAVEREKGQLVGVDLSPGMLARARERCERAGWSCVELREQDARQLPPSERFSLVNCALGLTVVPDWEEVFESTFALLEPGGRYLVLDVFAERRTLQTWSVERVAQADLRRRVWEPLERTSRAFELRWLPASPALFGGRLFVASGRR